MSHEAATNYEAAQIMRGAVARMEELQRQESANHCAFEERFRSLVERAELAADREWEAMREDRDRLLKEVAELKAKPWVVLTGDRSEVVAALALVRERDAAQRELAELRALVKDLADDDGLPCALQEAEYPDGACVCTPCQLKTKAARRD